ncbi:phosphatidyl-N-methylethanolamine N-methyltransferase isoform X2 [Prosopis cineraria]|uniref:phosphatidyl-N-methylethanolamine N-methyltransferase isoform X2 n=1 Tax=Prosopis cineraria TaxID=364024 RepID=UPI0024106AB6|nr:phosphatidyl-N-methylethanolamine N-methyltransferase isoform X2 [Prosopis cineraria]
MGIAAAIGILSPFPFYFWLWTWPQSWVDLCGKGQDPSKVMAHLAHFFKLVQFISLFSVSSFHWPPPLYFWPLFAFGQFLNFKLLNIDWTVPGFAEWCSRSDNGICGFVAMRLNFGLSAAW